MPNTDGQAIRKQSIPKHLNASLPDRKTQENKLFESEI